MALYSVNVRAVISFSIDVQAESEEDAERRFYEIDGDDLLSYIAANKMRVGDWNYDVTGAEIPADPTKKV